MPLISRGFSTRPSRKYRGTYHECLEALQGFAVAPCDHIEQQLRRQALRVRKAKRGCDDFRTEPPVFIMATERQNMRQQQPGVVIPGTDARPDEVRRAISVEGQLDQIPMSRLQHHHHRPHTAIATG